MASATDPAKKDAARVLYLTGMAYDDISKRVGVPKSTLQSWVTRGKWSQDRVSATSALASARAETAAEMAKRRSREIELFLDEQVRDAKLLRGKALEKVVEEKGVGLDGLKTAANVLQMASEMCRKAYGLDQKSQDTSQKTLVSISMAPGCNLSAPIGKPITAVPIDAEPIEA